MANNPFDPPVVQIKKTMDRGGITSYNRGFGSTRMQGTSSRPAPDSAPPQWYPENLSDLGDVDVTTNPPTHGQTLKWDASQMLWVPGSGGDGGGDGGGGGDILAWRDLESVPPVNQSLSSGSFNGMTVTLTTNVLAFALAEVRCRVYNAGEYTFSIDGNVADTKTSTSSGDWLVFDLSNTDVLSGAVSVSLDRSNGSSFRMYYTSGSTVPIPGLGAISSLNQSSGNSAPWEWHFYTYGIDVEALVRP